MKMKYDYLIVGSGLFGATFAYRAAKAGKVCLVIDKLAEYKDNWRDVADKLVYTGAVDEYFGYKLGKLDCYPVNDERNNALADEYRKLAAAEKDVVFGGRLAQYKYYDMAPVIEQVLAMNIA